MDEVSVLLPLSCGCLEAGEEVPFVGGTALPVRRIFLKASTSIAGLGRCASVAAESCCWRPKLASLVASVLANGLYGAFIPPAMPAAGGGSEPEFLRVLRDACSRSESAVAVESDAASSSSSSLWEGGGGDGARPAESEADKRRPPFSRS